MASKAFDSLEDLTDDDIEQAVGQMLIVGFDGATMEPPEALAEHLETGAIGGVILFGRNIDSVEQVCELNQSIHRIAEDAVEPPFVAVDQEGGRVTRLEEPLTPIPPMAAVGKTQDLELIADISEVIASEIGSLGFNLNFAPVLDVTTNPLNEVIGDRAFGSDPEFVSIAGGTFLFGHYKAGVIPCGKHFPGHGDTVDDSHETLPVLKNDLERLERVELKPFKRVVANEIPMLMTAHILLPALDARDPATLSAEVIGNLLREQLGYDGVVVTDDLEMDAIKQNYEIEEALQLGLDAGIDLFMFARSQSAWQRARRHLLDFAHESEENLRRILKSAGRVRRLKQNYLGHQSRPWSPVDNWQNWLGTKKHREVVERIDSNADTGTDPTL